jgi:hypothetical protein
MRRLFLLLPLCCVLAPEGLPRADDSGRRSPPKLAKVADDGKALPDQAGMERLARTAPLAFLEACLKRYDREVKGYTTTMQKQERLGGKLQRTEVIDVAFREKPFGVRMEWKKGERRAKKLLYVEGENDNKLLVVPAGLAGLVGVVARDPAGADVKESSRYPPTDFGIKVGMQKALGAWRAAQKRGELRVRFLGEQKVKEAGGRACWVLERTGYRKPEDDGITYSKFYFDKQTWLQVGTLLKGEEGKLIGEYFFRDVRLNPKFAPDAFTREGLKK